MGETEDEEPEIKWGRSTGRGGKQKKVKFYESFTFDNVEYFKYDCVYLFKEDEPEPYVGKLLKIWEANKQKKGKVLWFFHPDEISNFIGGVEDVVENELFLASGEATGLANINPLEAIAGKCNVVCISKDRINPQPTPEEVRKADFVFRRTFDVAEFKIKDEIKGEIAGTDVKFLLNRGESREGSGSANVSSETKEVSENALQNDLTGATNGDCNEPKNSDSVVKINGHCTDDTPANETGALTATCEKTVLDASTEPGKAKTISKVESKKRKERAGKVVKGAKDFDESDEKVSKKAKPASEIVDKGKSVIQDPVLGTEDTTVADTSLPTTSTEIKDKVKSVGDPLIKAEGPSKKLKLDEMKTKISSTMKTKDEIMPVKDEGSSKKSKLYKMKTKLPDTTKIRDEILHVEDSLVREEGPSKKSKLDETKAKLSGRKLIKAPSQEGRDEGRKDEGRELQLTIKDKSKWFKDLPWEDDLRTSHEHGKLVLLQNLDPSCTSTEVKAIIMSGFKVNCKAKMIQRTEFSSPHTGQAFAIFDTREVAEMVIKRLKESCLLLSSGRPLVASPGNPYFPKKKPTFYGHLIIDKIRGTMHREQKDAVSTSHCSQPNTIEYDMATEWCLLQARSESALKKLFEVQEDAVRELVDQLKDREKMKLMLLN